MRHLGECVYDCTLEHNNAMGLADLRPHAYGYPQMKRSARRASEVTATKTISGTFVNPVTKSHLKCRVDVARAVWWSTPEITSFTNERFSTPQCLFFLIAESECRSVASTIHPDFTMWHGGLAVSINKLIWVCDGIGRVTSNRRPSRP